MGEPAVARTHGDQFAADPVDTFTRYYGEHGPETFVREQFLLEPDAWQLDALRALGRGEMYLAMLACKGPGKTALLSWAAWWFLATRVNAKIAAVSVTWENLRDGLRTEMALWQQKSPLLERMFEVRTQDVICKESPKTWFLSFRNWAKSADQNAQSETLAGLHADNIMFILDESGAIPDSVAAAAEAAMANAGAEGREAFMLQAGNPSNLSGPLYRAATTASHIWRVIKITSDPQDPKRTPRVNPEWAQRFIDEYGRDHPWVKINILGEFPAVGANMLIGPDEIDAAMRVVPMQSVYEQYPKVMTIDVAWDGDDRTVFGFGQGPMRWQPRIYRNLEDRIYGEFIREHDRFKPDFVVGDESVMSKPIFASLRQRGYQVIGVNFGALADNPELYANKRAEMYDRLFKSIKAGQGLPPGIADLKRELLACAVYYLDDKGRMILRSKKMMKKDEGYSPDIADSEALFHAIDFPTAGAREMARQARGTRPHQYGVLRHRRRR